MNIMYVVRGILLVLLSVFSISQMGYAKNNANFPKKEVRVFDIYLLGGKSINTETVEITITNPRTGKVTTETQVIKDNKITTNLSYEEDLHVSFDNGNFIAPMTETLHGGQTKETEDIVETYLSLDPTKDTPSKRLIDYGYKAGDKFLYAHTVFTSPKNYPNEIHGLCIKSKKNKLVADYCKHTYTNLEDIEKDQWNWFNGKATDIKTLQKSDGKTVE